MAGKFDDLREKIRVTLLIDNEWVPLEEILLSLVDEIERVHAELHKGYIEIS